MSRLLRYMIRAILGAIVAFPTATMTDDQAKALNADDPGLQNQQVGSRLQVLEQRALHIQKVAITSDIHSTAQSVIAEVSGELVDAWAVGNAASGSGTATLRRSTTAMTSAITMAVQDALARTTSVVQAQKAVTQGETLNVITNGANDRGFLYFAILRS